MKKEYSSTTQLERAQERVKKLKSFYKHLMVYIIINGLLLLFSGKMTFILLSKEALGNPDFMKWINWNVYGTPIIWGLVLLAHAAVVFIPSPFKKWEERKIKSYMEKDRIRNKTNSME